MVFSFWVPCPFGFPLVFLELQGQPAGLPPQAAELLLGGVVQVDEIRLLQLDHGQEHASPSDKLGGSKAIDVGMSE